ncbi:MAG: acetylornithine carbamoyltransferase, partial [Lutibacter sp.]
MKHYININDLGNLQNVVQEAIAIKKNPLQYKALGEGKTICLLFFNNSLRTRLSTQKA